MRKMEAALQGKIEGKIYLLLSEGHSFSNIAKRVGKSPAAIYKRAMKYERKGLLERVVKYPAMFQIPQEILPGHNARHQSLPKALLAPHRFMATCAVVGQPNVRRQKAWFTYKDPEGEFTLQIGRDKARLSLKRTLGESPDERLQYGQERLKEIARDMGAKYGCALSIIRFDPQVEWTINDEPASRKVADSAKIKRDRPQEIADALWSFDDPTHPKLIEITKAKAKAPQIPTQHARTLHYLVTQAPSDIKGLIDAAKEDRKLLSEVVGGFVALRQKFEVKEKER